jgi:hypothetical protein
MAVKVIWRQRDAMLLLLDFFGHADDHEVEKIMGYAMDAWLAESSVWNGLRPNLFKDLRPPAPIINR